MPVISMYARQRVVDLHQQGHSQRKIATELKISRGGVRSIIKKHKSSKTIYNRSKPGRPRKLSERMRRLITLESKRNPRKTANQIRNSLNLTDNVKVDTVKRVLRNSDLFGRVSCPKPALSKINKKRRLDWCKGKREWNDVDWSKIIFSDETKIDLHPNTRQFVRRPKNKRFEKRYTTETRKFSQSLMVWGAIRADGRRAIFKCGNSVDSREYQRILSEAIPQIYSSRYVLMHDGATCHTSASTRSYLRENSIRMLENWPPQSPDINIIENLWDLLKTNVRNRLPQTIDDLWQYTQEEFFNIPNDYISNLYHSLPRRVLSIVHKKGGTTKY